MNDHILLKKEFRKKREKESDKRTRSKTDKNYFASGSNTTENPTDVLSSSLPNSVDHNEPIVAKELQKTTFNGDFSTDKILDQAKENVVKSAMEAKNEILRYTNSIQSYQEQNILYAQEIADNYINIQKLVINLLKLWWLPYWHNASLDLAFPLVSPLRMIEAYANIAGGFAGNTLRITRLVNDAMMVNLEFFKVTIERTKESSNDLAKASTSMVKKIERDSRGVRSQYAA